MAVTQIGITVGGNIKQFIGLDTDSKPVVDIGGGSKFTEINTEKVFIYDPVNINQATGDGWWEEY